MNLTNKSEIKNLLEKYNARPEKYFGQHFILSKNALRKMIGMAEIPHPLKKGGGLNNIIIEIGPGLGTLTRELAATGAQIIAIEKDPLMIKILEETLAGYKNAEIIQGDARRLKTSDVLRTSDVKYKIVANLPYNVATFLIRSWLESENPPQIMVLMVQKEVAQRMTAKPPRMNLLGASVQFYAEPKIIDYVPKEAFWPQPKIQSAIIKVVPRQKIVKKLEKPFFRTIKAGFSQPRKQLINNLSNGLQITKENLALIFQKIGLDAKARAENLGLAEWLKLTSELIHK